VRAVYDALADAASGSAASGPPGLRPTGFEAVRGPVTAAVSYAYDQQVLPRSVEFDEQC
jgi:4,5-dihydroxyphthalate decarboxylase